MDWSLIYLLSEWTIRLVMLLVVPQRRTPNAARAWLLLIFVQPWVGLLLYSWFGRPYLPQFRRRAQQRVREVVQSAADRYRHLEHPQLDVAYREAVTLAENLGHFPIMGGNRLELLPDYDGSIQRLVDDINAAQSSVDLMYYIFADDRTGGRVIEALSCASERGIACRVLIDSLGSKAWRRRLVPVLERAGVEVTLLLPFSLFRRDRARLDLRNHRKIAVIDGKIGYVGSQNLVAADFKPGICYHELVARVTGPVVLELQAVLLADRYLELQHETKVNLPEIPERTGDSLAQALPSGPGFPQANNQRLIVALIYSAQRRVVLTTPYFIPDAALLQALQTAVLRGVEVHLIVSRKPDQVMVGLAQRSYYEELMEANVQIHEYLPGLLHAKHFSIDESICLIGSSNLDIRSFQLNSEISLIVYDPAVVAALRAQQERDMADSERLDLETWRKRSRLQRTGQNLARLVDSLL